MKIEANAVLEGAMGVPPGVASMGVYEEVREAIRQALRDTLALVAARENLHDLLPQLLDELTTNVVALPPGSPRLAGTRPSARSRQLAAPHQLAAGHAIRLTAREHEVLQRISAGDSNKAIARALDLSLHTVKRHVANILTKLGVSSRVQAATWMHGSH